MARLSPSAHRLAVAFSGGPDSTALLHLTLKWAAADGVPVSALIVDHGLRPESGTEAELAAARARDAGADTAVLAWEGEKPETGRQEAAREARYALMTGWCADNGVTDLLLGHHLDDQAATVLMRLRHGSGIGGLAAMPEAGMRDGVRLLRPVLGLRKRDLTGWLTAQGLPWIEDPTNGSEAYERNRLNRLLAAEDGNGALTARLARLAARAARADQALTAAADTAWVRLARPVDGRIVLDRAGWEAEPEEIRLRLIARAIDAVAGGGPRLSGLEDALAVLPRQRRINLGGALISLGGKRLSVSREPQRGH